MTAGTSGGGRPSAWSVEAPRTRDGIWGVIRDQIEAMTQGQRQTTMLTLGLVVVLVVFGAPARHAALTATAAPTTEHPPTAPLEAQKPAPVSSPPPLPALAGQSPAPAVAPPAGPDGSHTPPGPIAVVPTLGSVVRIVALVEPSNSSAGRDDAAIAQTFLARGGFEHTTVTDDGSRSVCGAALRGGNVVLAHPDLSPQLRDCLIAGGATVIGYDAAGSVVPTAIGPGRFVSTRRSIYSTVLTTGLWTARDGKLTGPVGVVGASSARATIHRAVMALRGAGVSIAQETYVDSASADDGRIAQDVLAMHAARVSTVIFVVPQTVQQRWVAQASVLDPSMHYIVTDAFDGIVAEKYPPSFDGAVGYTSVRASWFFRDHPSDSHTRDANSCETIWQSSTTVPATAPGTETAEVLAWCEQVAALTQGLQMTQRLSALDHWLTTANIASPLTSDLAPLPRNDYGPTEYASVTWQASCLCWREATPFRPADERTEKPAR